MIHVGQLLASFGYNTGNANKCEAKAWLMESYAAMVGLGGLAHCPTFRTVGDGCW